MVKFFASLFFFFVTFCPLHSQIFPKEDSKLHYLIIGFSYPATPGAKNYRLEIAKGACNAEDSFNRNIIHAAVTSKNRSVADVPSFGCEYTWRVVSIIANAPPLYGELHHFSTVMSEDVDTNKVRLTILKKAEKYKDAYVFSDFNRTLYDMSGRPVWYFPATSELHFDPAQVRDLKITPAGTITFIAVDHDGYGINYNGEVLWKTPQKEFRNRDSLDGYNNELTMLSNGHYMILSREFVLSAPILRRQDGDEQKATSVLKRKVPYGIILEYDENGNLMWSWRSASYFQKSDVLNYASQTSGPITDVHQNSFFFDEKNSVIYVSYKNIHRILKVKYPSGTVSGTYGEIYKAGIPAKGNSMFCYQHSCKLSQNGYIYLFNNNSCNIDRAPEIVMMKEYPSVKDSLAPVWRYTFPVKSLKVKFKDRAHIRSDETIGGNVIELPGHSMFASLCSPYGDVFIIGSNKKILWHALMEKWDAGQNKWSEVFQYRASIIINRQELEKLIWNSEPKQ